MTKHRLAAYLDALADGKRPDSFDVDPEDVDVLRTAISLRAARPGDAVPDDGFVDRLYEELAEEANPQVVSINRREEFAVVEPSWPRWRRASCWWEGRQLSPSPSAKEWCPPLPCRRLTDRHYAPAPLKPPMVR